MVYLNLLISCLISDTSSSVMENSSVSFCLAVMYRRMIHFITSRYLFSATSRSLFLSGSGFLLQPRNRHMYLGVGMMLKGGGTVDPDSKYEIHSLVRANFHSVSDFSEMIYTKFQTVRNAQWIVSWIFVSQRKHVASNLSAVKMKVFVNLSRIVYVNGSF